MNLNTSIMRSSRAVAPARKIDKVHPAPAVHWAGDGFRLIQYFAPELELERKLDPFLRLDYHPPHDYPAAEHKRRGVQAHAAHGFQSIRLAFEGSVAHRDSIGTRAVLGPCEVDCVTAGSGIVQRESHEERFAQRGGTLHGLQLWLNSKAADKQVAPDYQGVVADQIRSERLPNAAGRVRVIAGHHQGITGPIKTLTPIRVLDGRLLRRGRVEFHVPPNENVALLVMHGYVRVNAQAKVAQTEFVVFANEGERITIDAETDAHWVLFSGEPINESIVRHGAFVTTTEAQFEHVMAEFQGGKFGPVKE